MKNKILLCCMLLFLAYSAFAQYSEEQQIKIANLEHEVEKFIETNIDEPLPFDQLYQFTNSIKEEKAHGHNIDADSYNHMLYETKYLYWRQEYFKINPKANELYDLPEWTQASCFNGNFDNGGLGAGGYQLWNGTWNGTVGAESNIASPPLSPNNNGTAGNLVNMGSDVTIQNGTDAISGIPQSITGNGARVNSDNGLNCSPNGGVNVLTKVLTMNQTTDTIFFSYAMVVQNPGNHPNQQPTFVARAVNNNNNNIVYGQIAQIANAANTAVFPLSGNTNQAGNSSCGAWIGSNWNCGFIPVTDAIGTQVRIEFWALDCGQSAHYGYAYIDDICVNCLNNPNITIPSTITMDSTDCCPSFPYQVCGSYTLPSVNGTPGMLNNITLNATQGGVDCATNIGTLVTDPINMTYCFTLTAADLATCAGQLDFTVTADFTVNGQSQTASDNDAVPNRADIDLDKNCCPDVCIVDCCQFLWGRDCNCADSIIPVFAVYCEDSTWIQGGPGVSLEWHNGQTSDIIYVTPGELVDVIVTTINGSDTCIDTAYYVYDYPDVEITYDTTGNYCDTIPFQICVTDVVTGLPVGSDYCLLWSDGSTTACITALPNIEYTVQVWDCKDSACYWFDTLTYCCDTLDFEIASCFTEFEGRSFTPAEEDQVKKQVRNELKAANPGMTDKQANSIITNTTPAAADGCDPCDLDSIMVWIVISGTDPPLVASYNDYQFLWSDGSTASTNWAKPNEMLIVTVSDSNSCAEPWTDTIFYQCCDSLPAPTVTSIQYVSDLQGNINVIIDWADVPDADNYTVIMEINNCCRSEFPGQSLLPITVTRSRAMINISSACCFRFRIRSNCENGNLGQYGRWSACIQNPWPPRGCRRIIKGGGNGEIIKRLTKDGINKTIDDVASELIAMPNPANGVVSFKFSNSDALTGNINVYTLDGQLVSSIEVMNANIATLDISALSSGLYFYNLEGEGERTEFKKLVIK